MKDVIMLKDKLMLIQRAYEKREVNDVDEFMDNLFHSKERLTVIGTSDNELCLDQEAIKKLFISDWKYWGDVKLDIEKATIRLHGCTAWIHLPGTVKYTFSDNDETYNRFIGFIQEFFDGESCDAKKEIRVKLTEINWLLAHLLHQREPKVKRDYLMQVRLYLVLSKRESRWETRHIQFSIPKTSMFADERFTAYTPYEKSYLKETDLLKNHSNYENLENEEKAFLRLFVEACFSNGSALNDDPRRFFTEDTFLINTNREVFQGVNSVAEKLLEMKSYWDETRLNMQSTLYGRNEDSLWIFTNGIMKKRIGDDQLFQYTENDVKKILDSELPDKEKLFLIRKSIATSLYEQSQGDEYIYPYRFEAFIIKKNNAHYIDYIQLSYPFNVILEQINDDC